MFLAEATYCRILGKIIRMPQLNRFIQQGEATTMFEPLSALVIGCQSKALLEVVLEEGGPQKINRNFRWKPK